MEPIPMMNRLMHQMFCPQFTPVYEGTAESGAYDVQPAAAWPPSTKKPESMMTPALALTKNDSMLRNGNAMSRAPIMSGMQKFPNEPARIGMITKKIMMVACIVNAMLYGEGSRIAPA